MKSKAVGVRESRVASHESRGGHAHPNYVGIWVWLLVLTVIEVAVLYLHLPRPLLISTLLILAVTKASLVAMYFMHLKFERRTLGLIAITPLVLCVLLVFALLPDLSATPHRSTEPPQAPAASH